MNLKKLLFSCLLLTVATVTFSQTKITAKCTADISCSQKFGITAIDREYTLVVVYDKNSLKFATNNTSVFSALNTYKIAKKTDNYIIASSTEGNYAFFDVKRKQLYNIDYYMDRYITAGYGSETNSIKQTVLKMMEILKKGGSQKDAIQELIKQAEYSF